MIPAVIPERLPAGYPRPGKCCVPGCKHPLVVGESELCPVHWRQISEFDAWVQGVGGLGPRGTFDEARTGLAD
jgi:hypothetical protein